jgi:hypothetical protein
MLVGLALKNLNGFAEIAYGAIASEPIGAKVGTRLRRATGDPLQSSGN